MRYNTWCKKLNYLHPRQLLSHPERWELPIILYNKVTVRPVGEINIITTRWWRPNAVSDYHHNNSSLFLVWSNSSISLQIWTFLTATKVRRLLDSTIALSLLSYDMWNTANWVCITKSINNTVILNYFRSVNMNDY